MNAKTNSEELEINNLSDDDLLRYNKHILLDEINEDGQKKLLESHVVLIGLGGLGCPVALYLSASGIGKITIIDHDDVELSNLQRQILFNPSDVGKNERFDAKRIKSANLVIDSTDNYITRSLINKITLNYKKPLIMGSAIKFSGQVALFRNDIKNQPCYNCLYNIKNEEKKLLRSGGIVKSNWSSRLYPGDRGYQVSN